MATLSERGPNQDVGPERGASEGPLVIHSIVDRLSADDGIDLDLERVRINLQAPHM